MDESMSKQQPQQQQEEEPGAVVKRTFTADMNPRGSGGGGSSTGKKSRSGSFKSVDASLSPSATHLHKVTTEKMKAAPARISRKDRNHHHHHHHHTAIKAAHAEREVAEQISNAGVGGITEPSSTAMTVATLPESESADSERLLGDHDVTVSRRELVVGAQLEAEEDAQPVAISSPIPSSRYGNPQDPPTLDASESAFAAERFPFDNEDNESDTEEGESPFLTYAQRQAQFGADRLEAKIAYFVQLRTAGSPFFQANPPVSLPIFDIEEIKLGMLLGQGEFGNVREVTEICDQAGNRDLPQLLRRLSTQNLQPQNPPHQRQVSMDVSFLQNHSRQSSSGGGPSSDGCRWQPSMGLESMIFEHDDHYEMLDESENTAAVAANRQENVNDDDNNEEGSMEMKELEEVDHARRARKVLKKRCWRDGKARYAVKQLRDDLCDYDEEDKEDHDHQHRTIGAMDLAMEAKLLASFSHPNICKLRGTAGVPGHPDYMLILDRLYMTLDEKIDEWRDELKKGKRLVGALTCQALFGKLFMRERTVDSSDATAMDAIRSKTSTQHRFGQSHLMFQKEQMLHRLYAAFDVARALRHLHRHKLLYRDLKPQNIAYDIRGDIRIFDFGLCKELVDRDLLQAPDDYKATGMTGSRRWMAPEVYLCAPYGFSADVFSFGLLLWNICSLKVPFGKKLTCESHHERVIVKRERPKRLCSKLISSSLMNLMECCWSVNRSKRPSFEEICTLLRFEIISLRDNIESSRAPGSPPIVTPGTSTLDRSKDKAAEEALKNATPTATSVDPGNGNDNISGEEVAMPSLGRTTTNETVRRSNANTPSCCANKGSKKDFFGRLFVGKKGEDSRKKFQNSKFDAVNTSCHIRGRHKQAQIRNRHNGNSLKNRASRLFIPHSSVSRRSSLEQRSVYLMEKSDLSLEDLQISSGNINFSMHHLQNIPSQESPRVFEDLPGSSP